MTKCAHNTYLEDVFSLGSQSTDRGLVLVLGHGHLAHVALVLLGKVAQLERADLGRLRHDGRAGRRLDDKITRMAIPDERHLVAFGLGDTQNRRPNKCCANGGGKGGEKEDTQIELDIN